MSLRVPGAGAYAAVTAQTLDTNGTRYSGFAEVTNQVRAAGVGAYTVANVQAGTGEDRYAAWELIVVYRDATEPPRNLTVFDGLATISRSTPSATLSLSGFTTPPFGPVRSTVGPVEQRRRPHLDGRQRDAELDADLRPGEPREQRVQLVHHPVRRQCRPTRTPTTSTSSART